MVEKYKGAIMSTTDKRGWNGCGCGCLGFLLLGLFFFIFAQFQTPAKKEEVVVGTTLYKTAGFMQTMGISQEMSEQRSNHSVLLAQDIWDSIHEHPSVNRLVLCLNFGTSRSLMVDKYGHNVSDVFNYKIIEINDVAEIRKYADAAAYGFNQALRYQVELDDVSRGEEYTSLPKFNPDQMEKILNNQGNQNGPDSTSQQTEPNAFANRSGTDTTLPADSAPKLSDEDIRKDNEAALSGANAVGGSNRGAAVRPPAPSRSGQDTSDANTLDARWAKPGDEEIRKENEVALSQLSRAERQAKQRFEGSGDPPAPQRLDPPPQVRRARPTDEEIRKENDAALSKFPSDGSAQAMPENEETERLVNATSSDPAARAETVTATPPSPALENSDQRTFDDERYPQTRQRVLTLEEIKTLALSRDDVQYAINEIYARYGAVWKTKPDIQHQFEKLDWYQPRPAFTFDQIDGLMSDVERENVKVLAQYRTTAWQSLPGAPPRPGPLLTDEQATAAFNMNQGDFGKPHAKKVWYNKKADSYQWIDPREGKTLMMPRTQFEAEIGISYLEEAQ
jgi:hypothetical protein